MFPDRSGHDIQYALQQSNGNTDAAAASLLGKICTCLIQCCDSGRGEISISTKVFITFSDKINGFYHIVMWWTVFHVRWKVW